MGSVRARATLGATLVVAVALVSAGLLLLWLLRGNLQEQVDLQAEVTGRDVAAQLATGRALDDLDLDGTRPVQVVDRDGLLYQVSDGLEEIGGTGVDKVVPDAPTREEVRQSERDARQDQADADADDDDDDADDDDDEGNAEEGAAGDSDEQVPGPGEMDEEIGSITGSAVVDGEWGEYRFAVVEVNTPWDEDLVVYAGAPLDIERAAIDSVRTSMLVGVPALLAVVAAVTWLVTRRALRPVEGIRRGMADITRSEDLSRRVPEPASRDEVGRLARTTNETLAALESSVDRQRRFVADASHELRSPIASLRTQLEVGEAHPELLDLPGAVQDTVRLQGLAADLLLLARLDAGERPLGGSVDLTTLVTEVLDERIGDRHPVVPDEVAEATVRGSRGQLSRVLGNLLDNAQRHAAGRVRVSLRVAAGRALLEVGDDGDGVPEADRERIFERFVRLDDARSRDDGGAGLGLAIARDVARRHGGELAVGSAPEGGALFTLDLPLASRDSAPDPEPVAVPA
ncbi:HAMP domain-containing sensor histidine kinase [Streptomyces sp. DSM 44915]|uniref:histidine kinase n=1 Tax=Streptomyces chisholmiae TaxID=3075540 RepID=A0ABU2JI89_9ACTN|nr:HAMP domain-containing sensor histidine kinase [Streptomyces sp. DSM 44915]MDT0264687.1 HAMP domain-containing sensor histidine kinase [Streptomyces sp. DSM 44915]